MAVLAIASGSRIETWPLATAASRSWWVLQKVSSTSIHATMGMHLISSSGSYQPFQYYSPVLEINNLQFECFLPQLGTAVLKGLMSSLQTTRKRFLRNGKAQPEDESPVPYARSFYRKVLSKQTYFRWFLGQRWFGERKFCHTPIAARVRSHMYMPWKAFYAVFAFIAGERQGRKKRGYCLSVTTQYCTAVLYCTTTTTTIVTHFTSTADDSLPLLKLFPRRIPCKFSPIKGLRFDKRFV